MIAVSTSDVQYHGAISATPSARRQPPSAVHESRTANTCLAPFSRCNRPDAHLHISRFSPRRGTLPIAHRARPAPHLCPSISLACPSPRTYMNYLLMFDARFWPPLKDHGILSLWLRHLLLACSVFSPFAALWPNRACIQVHSRLPADLTTWVICVLLAICLRPQQGTTPSASARPPALLASGCLRTCLSVLLAHPSIARLLAHL